MVMQLIFDHLKQWPMPLLIFLAGFIWGVTNPLLSATSKPTTTNNKTNQSFFNSVLSWLPFAIVFGINQIGSLFNIILLGIGDLATVTPFTNTISFFVTAVVDTLFFSKRKVTLQYVCGLFCIAFGAWIAMAT